MNPTDRYMRRAIQLARNGELDASPNPMVGAVIVTPECLIAGEGWHRKCGLAHAEVNAVNDAHEHGITDFSKCDLYVTLEPCSHYGKTPPCARLVASLGFHKVVVGMTDPNPKVAGRGIKMIQDAGINVVMAPPVIAGECRLINPKFLHSCTSSHPFVTLKWAQYGRENSIRIYQKGDKLTPPSSDAIRGKISTPATLSLVHRLRATHDAILVGSGTVIADDPRLDTRLYAGTSPLRVVLDRRGRVPASAKVFRDLNVAYFCDRLRDDLPREIQHIAVEDPLEEVRRMGITSVLVEGGAGILKYFIDHGLWDAARVETRVPNPSPGIPETAKID